MTIIGATVAVLLHVMAESAVTYGVDDCVRLAVEGNARVGEGEARVREYGARLEQAQALFAPAIHGIALLAPMYTVRGDIYHYDNAWKSLSDWGPYTHLQATLSQPLYTFGRASEAKRAASERAELERARLRETQNVIAWETRKLYYTLLYVRTLLPALAEAHVQVTHALARAEDVYASASGEVAQSDLSRLQFADTQIQRATTIAEKGASIAIVALKHTMGMSADATFAIADERLPPMPDDDARDLASYVADAASNRPEWQQLAHGKAAARALSAAEIKANLPILALVGQTELGWSPTRENATNPYVYDPYNMATGILALGLVFDLNPWQAAARERVALAQYEQVEALERFASTGIPLQVRNAWVNLRQSRQLVAIADESLRSARTWVTFSASAYDTGIGEPRELLEGMAALMESRRMLSESLRDYYLAGAELTYATGAR